MKTYDEQRQLARLNDAMGLPRAFRLDIKDATQNRALWGTCEGFMPLVIHCLLCGKFRDAQALLSKSKTWIELALQIGEKARHFEEWSHKFQQHLYAAILWLHDDVHDQKILDLWLEDTLSWFQVHSDRVAGSDLALQAVSFINACAYRDYIALAAPNGIDSIKCSGANEKQMALTLAVQALTQNFPEEQIQEVVKRFLDNHVGKWLNDGRAVRAAEWMKVIYWKRGENGISPFDAVRKCLDHVNFASV